MQYTRNPEIATTSFKTSFRCLPKQVPAKTPHLSLERWYGRRPATSTNQGEAMPQTRRNGNASGQEAPTDEPVPLADALDPALAELLAAAAGAQRPREGEEPVHARDAPARAEEEVPRYFAPGVRFILWKRWDRSPRIPYLHVGR